jgi:two-component system chemotaxis response regulator CheB
VIKLLIVDDSPLMRRLLTEIFESAGDFEVVVARDGQQAVAMLTAAAPDVITLDINMPGMNGLACLDEIMIRRPCPVVMVSSLTADGANETLEAMALGAVDFIAKPKGAVSLEIDAVAPQLIERVRAAAAARISRATRLRERVRATAHGALKRSKSPTLSQPARLRPPLPSQVATADGIVLIGSSTGGPPALDAVLGDLPADFPWPIVVAQHMPASFTGPMARRLDRACALAVREVDKPVRLEPGHVYIGRGDADIVLSRRTGAIVALSAPSSADYFWHPSVDRLVASAMRLIAPESLIGVLLTGMGTDGASAMRDLKLGGGHTIAESAETAVVWGMPGALVELGGASSVLPLEHISRELFSMFPS